MKNDGGPAFPCALPSGTDEEIGRAHALGIGVPHQSFSGASLRDYFAAAALTGYVMRDILGSTEFVAEQCYELADAMLKEGQS